MTTAQQRRFYFPAWNAAAAAHGWKGMVGDRLRATKKTPWGAPQVDKIYRAIWLVAESLADEREAPGSLCEEDLRHACNHLASEGKTTSCRQLNTRQISRVVRGLLGWTDWDAPGKPFRPGLLIDPYDTYAILAWDNPELAAREGVLIQLRKLAPLAYIISVSRGKFSRDDWENLTDAELSQLLFTLKARARSKAEARPAVGGAASSGAALSEPQLAEQPF